MLLSSRTAHVYSPFIRTSAYKEMSTLTALEGFPMPFSVQPRAPLPPLSKESVLENGIKISSIDNSSGVRSHIRIAISL